MSITAVYQPAKQSARIIKGRHDGKPKRWTVAVRYRPFEGRERYTVTFYPKAECQLSDLAALIEQHLRSEGDVRDIQWTAISR